MLRQIHLLKTAIFKIFDEQLGQLWAIGAETFVPFVGAGRPRGPEAGGCVGRLAPDWPGAGALQRLPQAGYHGGPRPNRAAPRPTLQVDCAGHACYETVLVGPDGQGTKEVGS